MTRPGWPNSRVTLSGDTGCELVSTGGTARTLADAGLPVTQVADLTGSPEILDGRVKTLHPTVHGGILARRDLASHQAELESHGIGTIDVVVGNLYPFVDTVSAENVTLQDALENIDIGGPTMIRAAAKNFPSVLVLVDPGDYAWASERIAKRGLPAPYSDTGSEAAFSMDERRELARKAFQHVALYDTAVARYLTGDTDGTSWPELTFGYDRVADLRYGENPHQKATLYASSLSSGGIVRAEKLHGIDMSYTNYLDADAAWRVVSDFSRARCHRHQAHESLWPGNPLRPADSVSARVRGRFYFGLWRHCGLQPACNQGHSRRDAWGSVRPNRRA